MEPGTVLAAPTNDGRWTAYVVVSADDQSTAIAELDCLRDEPPTLAEARKAGLIQIDHHNWNGRPHYLQVSSATPPARWRTVGRIDPPDLGPCNAYAGWPDGFSQAVLQARWNELPAKVRAAYKACTTDDVTIDPGAGLAPITIRRDRSEVTLGSRETPLAARARVRWGALDPLAHLSDLSVYGDPAGVVEHVRARPLIDTLFWGTHGRTKIDLSTTRLRSVSVEVPGALELRLPDTVEELTVSGDPGALAVKQPLRGARLRLLMLRCSDLPRGLDRLRALGIHQVATIDLAPIVRAAPALEQLGVSGPATRLAHIERLAALPRLRRLELRSCFQLDAAKVPAASTWPEIDRVLIHGHRKADAAALRKRLGAAPQFELSGGKTDAWLAANLDNPFRDWIDDAPRLGRAAVAAWKKARAAIDKAKTAAARKKVLQAFVETFNKLDKGGEIDTIRREQIFEAFHPLVAAAGVDADAADGWFDAWRDF